MDKAAASAAFSPTGEHREDPYSFYAWARESLPVFFSPELDMWCVTRYEDVSAILGNPGSFASGNVISDFTELAPEARACLAGYRRPRNLINLDPPEHTALRTLVRQAFRPRNVAAMEPTIREVTNAVIDEFADDGCADLIAQLAFPLPLTVILRLLGIPADDLDLLRQWTADLVELHLSQRRLPAERQVELAGNVLAYQQYVEDLAADRAEAPGEDLVSYLVEATDEAGDVRLAPHQVADITQSLVIGGHGTTANAFGNILHLLLCESARWRAVCRDPSLIASAIEEGLRADTAVSGMIRTVTSPTVVGGVELAEGTRIFLLFGSANTDGRAFQDADTFRPDRTGQPSHLAFGRGIHYCIGAPLARLEMKIALEALTKRLPGLRLDGREPLRHIPVPLFRGFASLPVNWER